MRGREVVTFYTDRVALILNRTAESLPALPPGLSAKEHLRQAAQVAADEYLPRSPSGAAILCCYFLTLHEGTILLEGDVETKRMIRKAAERGREEFVRITTELLG